MAGSSNAIQRIALQKPLSHPEHCQEAWYGLYFDKKQKLNGNATVTGLEALQSVQYVTVNGRRLAVVDANDWEAMLEWLETVEDIEIAKAAYAALKAANGDRDHVGWLKWGEVRNAEE